MQKIILELKRLPDLSLAKYSSLEKSGVSGVIEKQNIFLKQWNKICLIYGISMHLIYTYSAQKKIKMHCYFLLSGEDGVRDVAKLLPYSPIGEYYCFEEVSQIEDMVYNAASMLVKKERTVPVETEKAQYIDIGIVPEWEMNENARLFDMFQMLKAVGNMNKNQEFAYRVDLFPCECSECMRNAFQPYIQMLRKCSGELDNEIVLLTDQKKNKRDSSAREIMKIYDDFIEMIEVSSQFETHILAFADSQAHAEIILGTVGAECLEKGYYDLLPLRSDNHGNFNIYSRMEKTETVYSRLKDKGKYDSFYLKWNIIFSCEQVSPFFRFPALYEGEIIDIPKETAPILEADKDKIVLGYMNKDIEVSVPLKNLVKHTMICGVPGSGKTNTMLQLATQLWRDHKIPFLIFEPAKKEYRALLNDQEMKDVLLFSPKMGSQFPIKINPFEFPLGLSLSEHISTLLSVFSGSFSLVGPTYYFLDLSIQKAYTDKGWYLERINDDTLEYPSLSDVYVILEKEIEKSSYDGEVKGNVKSFLQVRLGGLMKRDAGAIFNTNASSLQPEKLFQYPIVVELEALDNQDKNFFILLMCSIIMEILRVNPNAELDKQVRHVIFIEEAHNLIAQTTQQSSSETVDPKISATAFVVKMLAEVRALREAIIITDQLPSALAPEIMKNTSLKIVHRLTAEDDRSMVGGTMAASPQQLEELPVYNVGEAMVFYEKLRKPFKIRMLKWKEDDMLYIPQEEKMLFELLIKEIQYRKIYARTTYVQITDMYFTEYLQLQTDFNDRLVNLDKLRGNYFYALSNQGRHAETYMNMYHDNLKLLQELQEQLKMFLSKLMLFDKTEVYLEEGNQFITAMKMNVENMIDVVVNDEPQKDEYSHYNM